MNIILRHSIKVGVTYHQYKRNIARGYPFFQGTYRRKRLASATTYNLILSIIVVHYVKAFVTLSGLGTLWGKQVKVNICGMSNVMHLHKQTWPEGDSEISERWADLIQVPLDFVASSSTAVCLDQQGNVTLYQTVTTLRKANGGTPLFQGTRSPESEILKENDFMKHTPIWKCSMIIMIKRHTQPESTQPICFQKCYIDVVRI